MPSDQEVWDATRHRFPSLRREPYVSKPLTCRIGFHGSIIEDVPGYQICSKCGMVWLLHGDMGTYYEFQAGYISLDKELVK